MAGYLLAVVWERLTTRARCSGSAGVQRFVHPAAAELKAACSTA
jgi:hypothetical protein